MYSVGGEEKKEGKIVRDRGKRRWRRRCNSETMSRQKCKAHADVCVCFA